MGEGSLDTTRNKGAYSTLYTTLVVLVYTYRDDVLMGSYRIVLLMMAKGMGMIKRLERWNGADPQIWVRV